MSEKPILQFKFQEVTEKPDSGMCNSTCSNTSASNALKGMNPSIFQSGYLTPGETDEKTYYSPPRQELSKFKKNVY